MYETLASFAQTGGVIYFFGLFLAVCAYALWPRNQNKFNEAAQLPLSDKEPGDE